MTNHSGLCVILALILIGVSGYGLSRVPTGFIPIEDQGYLLVAVQLPDGAALERTRACARAGQRHRRQDAGRRSGHQHRRHLGARQFSSSLANAGVAYMILKEWSERGAGQDLRSLFVGLNEKMAAIPEARILVIPPPPIQGIGNAAGFAMQVQLRDGNADFGKLQAITGAIVANAQTQSALQRVSSSFRSMVPQFDVEVDRIKTQTLHVTTDQVFSTLASYLGLVLRQPVHQVRPHLPGLRPGRCAVSPDAARYRKPDGAQSAGRHGSARHGRDHHARRSVRR